MKKNFIKSFLIFMDVTSWKKNNRVMDVFVLVAFVCLTVASFLYYRADHKFPPCCDAAITIMKAKEIVQQKQLNPWQTYNPSFPERAYGSVFSTEAAGHFLLASLFYVHPEWSYDISFSNNFFVILFVLAMASISITAGLISRKPSIGLLTYLLLFFMYWFGNSYWTGHVAELLGLSMIAWGTYFLNRWTASMTWKRASWPIIFGVLLFFSHVLSFIVFFILSVVVITLEYWKQKKRRHVLLAWVMYIFSSFLYFRFTQSTQLLPTVDTSNLIIYPLNDILQSITNTPALVVLGLLGVIASVQKKTHIFLVLLATGYFLSQSTYIGTPFYAYRFSVFFAPALASIIAIGIDRIFVWKVRSLQIIAVAAVLLYIPFSFHRQQVLKSCYVQNCMGLYPTQMPVADNQAYQWMRDNLPRKSVITANQKFGYYLPIVTDHLVEFPVVEKRDIFINPSARERNRIAKDFKIKYVFWDAIFTQQRNSVLEALDFKELPFENTKFFKKIYSNSEGARVYEVL